MDLLENQPVVCGSSRLMDTKSAKSAFLTGLSATFCVAILLP
jgi:hypothetical protein